jgi:hypothetical protein
MRLPKLFCILIMSASLHAAEITVTDSPGANDLASDKKAAAIFIEIK